jgi:asparagine synthase (glutamine-hydrolysing)
MCGIVGILARKTQIPPAVLERATRSLEHRGPDDSGTVLLKDTQPGAAEVGLGHRRLAILDLSPLGHQPMHDPVTGNWIVFNGEIYNFRELRKELEGAGVEFKSHSETEVILAAYRVWVREEPVKGITHARPVILRFKNAPSSANIVTTFYLPTEWT